MSPDDGNRLRHMVEAMNAAIRFTKDRTREDLDKDEMLSFALLHSLQIVGEAAAKVSTETRNQYPQIPWDVNTKLLRVSVTEVTQKCNQVFRLFKQSKARLQPHPPYFPACKVSLKLALTAIRPFKIGMERA